jgi:hypothetical protein
VIDPDLQVELLCFTRRDQETRERLRESGGLFQGYAPAMERVHLENARRLEAILDRVGWPTAERVGAEGAEAAWLVAQHAISWPAFQRRCRALLAAAVAEGAAPPRHLAYLTDRIRFNERRPQVHGTIFDWDPEGRLSPWPIADPDGVEARRRDAGLPPLAAETDRLRRQAEREGDAPPGRHGDRQREIEAWARRVGWLDPE